MITDSHELEALVIPLLTLSQQAGDEICDYYHSPDAGHFQSKSDDSPLTQADLASHQRLSRGLSALRPALPILSEESSEEETSRRHDWPAFWMVDPLDGTKEFLERTGEFTINIALVVNHKPVLGLIYLPLQKLAYVGIPGGLANRYNLADNSVQSLQTRAFQRGRPLCVLASRRHRGPRLQACLDWLERQWGEVRRDNSGSALKFCQMAAGDGDIYPRYSPCCEWDTAAGQALLEAAGGALLGLDGRPLQYNLGDSLLSANFIALGDPGHGLSRALLARETALLE